MLVIEIANEVKTVFLLGSYNPVQDYVDIRITTDLLKELAGQAFLILSVKIPDKNAAPLDRRTALNAGDENDPAACVINFNKIEVNDDDTGS